MMITEDKFIAIFNKLIEKNEQFERVDDAMSALTGEYSYIGGCADSFYTIIVDLVANTFTNSASAMDLIEYWMYELDFGKDYRLCDWMDDWDDVPLKTVNDLWNALQEYV